MNFPGARCQDQLLLEGTGTNPVGPGMNGPDGIWHQYWYQEDSGPEHNQEVPRRKRLQHRRTLAPQDISPTNKNPEDTTIKSSSFPTQSHQNSTSTVIQGLT